MLRSSESLFWLVRTLFVRSIKAARPVN